MWNHFTNVLTDGLKEFRDALVEDTPPSTPPDGAALKPEFNTPQLDSAPELTRHDSFKADVAGLDEVSQEADQQTPAHQAYVSIKEQPSFENWEVRMLENEIARLRAEVESLKSRNKELEHQYQLLSTAQTNSPHELSSLHEENKLLKKTMKDLMNKLVPPPEATPADASPSVSPLIMIEPGDPEPEKHISPEVGD